jgi:hypothetical protein
MSECSSRAVSNPDMQGVNIDIESELSPIKLEMSQIQDYISDERNKQREIETQLLSKIPGLTELDFDKAENVSGEGEMLSRVIDITDYRRFRSGTLTFTLDLNFFIWNINLCLLNVYIWIFYILVFPIFYFVR